MRLIKGYLKKIFPVNITMNGTLEKQFYDLLYQKKTGIKTRIFNKGLN